MSKESPKSQTLEEVIGGGFAGSMDGSYAMISIRTLDPSEAIFSGAASNGYMLALERVSQDGIDAMASSGDSLFYLISAAVSIKAVKELMETGTRMPDGSYTPQGEDYSSGNYEEDGDGWKDGASTMKSSKSIQVASLVSQALIEGGKVSASPYLVSRGRRARVMNPVQSEVQMGDILTMLTRSYDRLSELSHERHVKFADMVAQDPEACGSWFESEGGRHERNQAEAGCRSISDFGVDISGLSAPPPPPAWFYNKVTKEARKREETEE